MAIYKSRLQKTPACSTTEAEYMAASDGCTHVYDTRENLMFFGSRELPPPGGVRKMPPREKAFGRGLKTSVGAVKPRGNVERSTNERRRGANRARDPLWGG